MLIATAREHQEAFRGGRGRKRAEHKQRSAGCARRGDLRDQREPEGDHFAFLLGGRWMRTVPTLQAKGSETQLEELGGRSGESRENDRLISSLYEANSE